MAATGTIAVTNNSKSITGTDTKFTTELATADIIYTVIQGVNWSFIVDTINSDTSLTITAAYTGNAVSGQQFTAIPRMALTGITGQLAVDTAMAIRGLNYDKANWQQILTSPDNATVNLPDRSQYTGPSWPSLNNSLSSINDSLGKKANADDVTTALGKKANADDVTTALGKKANADDVATALGKKLDTSGGIVNYIAFGADGNTKIRYVLSSNIRYLVIDRAILYPTSGYRASRGIDGVASSSAFNYYWTGSVLEAWIDSTQVGNVSLTSVSDKGLKEGITYKDRGNSLSEVKSWKPATFRMKKRGIIPQSDTKLGFIANDLALTSPECVIGEGLPDDYDIEKDPNNSSAYQLDQVAMIAKLTMAIQELAAKVGALEQSNTQVT